MNKNILKSLALAAVILSVTAAMTACSSESGRNYHVTSSNVPSSSQSVSSSAEISEKEELVSESSENESSEAVSSESVSSKTVSSKTVSSEVVSSKTQPKTESKPVIESKLESEPVESSVDYEQMYRDFMNSGNWRIYENSFSGRNVSIENCDIKYSTIFDMDGDGIPELLIYAEAPYTGPRIMSASGFYTIKNDKIVPLLIGSTCGGTLGGETVSLAEESGTGKLYIGSFGYTGGFGGTGGYTSIYDYKSGALSLLTEYSGTEYTNSSLGENEYEINSVSVTSEEYSAEVDKYKMVSPQDVSSKVS